jgi:hypothetical protein
MNEVLYCTVRYLYSFVSAGALCRSCITDSRPKPHGEDPFVRRNSVWTKSMRGDDVVSLDRDSHSDLGNDMLSVLCHLSSFVSGIRLTVRLCLFGSLES